MSKLYSYQNQLCTTILNKAKRYSFAPRPLLQSETKQKLTSFPSEHSSGENVLLFYALAERTNHSWRSDSGRFCPRIYTAIPITINPRTTAIGTVIGSWSDIDRNSNSFSEQTTLVLISPSSVHTAFIVIAYYRGVAKKGMINYEYGLERNKEKQGEICYCRLHHFSN